MKKQTYTDGALYKIQFKGVLGWRDDSASGKYLNANVELIGRSIMVKGVIGYPKGQTPTTPNWENTVESFLVRD